MSEMRQSGVSFAAHVVLLYATARLPTFFDFGFAAPLPSSLFPVCLCTKTSIPCTSKICLMTTTNNVFLTLLISLYYFALQPWAIIARGVLVILAFAYSIATSRTRLRPAVEMKTSGTIVESIERKTKRTISIEDTPTEANLAKCNPQSQSPLYTKLPKELRDLIFAFASSQSPDDKYRYDPNAYHYRPDHPARLRTYTSLLQTCRLVWLEANALPMLHAEHAFWFQRGPHDRHPDSGWRANVQNERNRYHAFLNSLSPRNLRNVSRVRLFMQMFQAEQLARSAYIANFFPREVVGRGFRPKRFTVSVRSTDWWNWERGQSLGLPEGWVQSLLDSQFLGGVGELAVELECVEDRQGDQLDAIVQSIRKLEGRPKLVDVTGRDRSHACKFVLDDEPKSEHWTRSPRIDNKDYDVYSGMSTLQLRSTTLVWKNKPCSLPDPVPEPAYSSHEETRPTHTRVVAGPPGFTVRIGTPALIMRSRAQRERLRSGGWMPGRFPEKSDEMWTESVRRADRWAQSERERFEKWVGDIEAERLRKQWRARGSLLRFVDEEA